ARHTVAVATYLYAIASMARLPRGCRVLRRTGANRRTRAGYARCRLFGSADHCDGGELHDACLRAAAFMGVGRRDGCIEAFVGRNRNAISSARRAAHEGALRARDRR